MPAQKEFTVEELEKLLKIAKRKELYEKKKASQRARTKAKAKDEMRDKSRSRSRSSKKKEKYITVENKKEGVISYNVPESKKNLPEHKGVRYNGHDLYVYPKVIEKLFNDKKGVYSVDYRTKPYPVTEATVKYLAGEVTKLGMRNVNKVKQRFPAGANIYMKLFMSSGDVNASAVIKINDANEEQLWHLAYAKLFASSGKAHPTADYILDLRNVLVLVSGFGARGGCTEGKTKVIKRVINLCNTIHFTNHKSSGNNCLLQCFNAAYKISGRVLKAAKIRAELDLKKGKKIHMNKIHDVCDFFNEYSKKKMGYVLINKDLKIIKFYSPLGLTRDEFNVESTDDRENMVQLCLMDDHYYTYKITSYHKCETCGEKLLSTNETHKCTKDRISYYNNMIAKKKDMVMTVKLEKPKLDYETVVHFDLETFQPKDGGIRHEVYASGFYDREYKVFYGREAGKKTWDHFMKLENRIISAYNGAGFDFTFMLDALTERGAHIENLVMNNGRLMCFHYHTGDESKKNKIFDLCLFTSTSLKKACDDFKIKNAKSELEHNLFKSWDDVKTYKDKVLPYLKLDVMGLKELFEKFNDVIYEIEKTNITEFFTLAHLGYDIWRSMLTEIVEIPKCLTKMDFIAKAVYGGRCNPQQQLYKSAMYDDVKSGKLKYDDVIKSKSKDFIFNADASSLYPASMSGFDHLKVKYPIGYSRWSDTPLKEFNAGLMGFYEIFFVCPKNIRVPVLPRRKLEGQRNVGVSWSLEDGRGVYTSVDIRNAVDAGYKIKFHGKALVYDESGDVYSPYIKKFYKLKGQAEKDGNDSMRNIAKLLLNSLYGKMLMAPINENTEIVNDAVEMNDFMLKYDLVDYNIINDGKVLLTGAVKGQRKIEKITKPRQLGAFVTAYSRRVMLFYMKKIDPTLQTTIFTYTDTDSLHITGKAYLSLLKQGLIKTKKEAELGYLCSDISNEGIILKEINLAPKTYFYESIDNINVIKVTKKCKGIPKDQLKELDYEIKGQVIAFSGLKKKTTKLTKADREAGIKLFSVCNSHQTRTFMKNDWKGFKLIDNEYYPHGYEFPESDE